MSISLFFTNIFIMMFLVSLVGFIYNWNHLLSALVALEAAALSLFLLIAVLKASSYEIYMNLFYLAIIVSEGALALSLLILFTRVKGNQFLTIKNLLKW